MYLQTLNAILFGIVAIVSGTLPYPWDFYRLECNPELRFFLNSLSYIAAYIGLTAWFVNFVLRVLISMSRNGHLTNLERNLAIFLALVSARHVLWPALLFSAYFTTCSYYPWATSAFTLYLSTSGDCLNPAKWSTKLDLPTVDYTKLRKLSTTVFDVITGVFPTRSSIDATMSSDDVILKPHDDVRQEHPDEARPRFANVDDGVRVQRGSVEAYERSKTMLTGPEVKTIEAEEGKRSWWSTLNPWSSHPAEKETAQTWSVRGPKDSDKVTHQRTAVLQQRASTVDRVDSEDFVRQSSTSLPGETKQVSSSQWERKGSMEVSLEQIGVLPQSSSTVDRVDSEDFVRRKSRAAVKGEPTSWYSSLFFWVPSEEKDQDIKETSELELETKSDDEGFEFGQESLETLSTEDLSPETSSSKLRSPKRNTKRRKPKATPSPRRQRTKKTPSPKKRSTKKTLSPKNRSTKETSRSKRRNTKATPSPKNRGSKIQTPKPRTTGRSPAKRGCCGHCHCSEVAPIRLGFLQLREPFETRSGLVYGPTRYFVTGEGYVDLYELTETECNCRD